MEISANWSRPTYFDHTLYKAESLANLLTSGKGKDRLGVHQATASEIALTINSAFLKTLPSGRNVVVFLGRRFSLHREKIQYTTE